MVAIGTTSTFMSSADSKKGHQSSGNTNFQRSAKPIGGRPEPKEGNGGDVPRPRKDCAKCGRDHSG